MLSMLLPASRMISKLRIIASRTSWLYQDTVDHVPGVPLDALDGFENAHRIAKGAVDRLMAEPGLGGSPIPRNLWAGRWRWRPRPARHTKQLQLVDEMSNSVVLWRR